MREIEVEVEVKDTKERILDAAEQLFAPMRSGRKRSRERHLGLGLYVARVIAEHHGGGIRAWNTDENRVVFEVTIRRAAAPDPGLRPAAATPSSTHRGAFA